jgi:4-amino-4-deoxy-L-arabinose transferase-like glycosyltransferase
MLALVLLLAAALRLWKIDSPIGGFQGFREAHDTLITRHFLEGGSLLAPTPDGSHLSLETPPLLPYILLGIFRVTGVSIVAGRLVSVAASLGLVLVAFWLGRRLFSAAAGLAAAVLVAVTPVSVLAGRNIQADVLSLFFLAAAYFFWGKAEEGSAFSRLAAGALAGLALSASLLAAVGLVALLAWEVGAHGLGFLRDKFRWAAAVIALAPPALFYGYHLSRDSASVRNGVTGFAAAAALPTDATALRAIGLEAVWALSPLVAALLVAGALMALARPSQATLFALLPFLFFAVLSLFLHGYGYSLLWVLPWGALLVGRLIGGLPLRAVRAVALVLVAASGAFVSAVDVCSMKLGFSEFAGLGRTAPEIPGDAHRYLVDREMWGGYASIISYYDPKARLTVAGDGPPAEEESYLLVFVPPQARIPQGGWLFERQHYGLELFGITVSEAHADPRFFLQGSYVFLRTGEPLDFGLKELKRHPALALAPLGVAATR